MEEERCNRVGCELKKTKPNQINNKKNTTKPNKQINQPPHTNKLRKLRTSPLLSARWDNRTGPDFQMLLKRDMVRNQKGDSIKRNLKSYI